MLTWLKTKLVVRPEKKLCLYSRCLQTVVYRKGMRKISFTHIVVFENISEHYLLSLRTSNGREEQNNVTTQYFRLYYFYYQFPSAELTPNVIFILAKKIDFFVHQALLPSTIMLVLCELLDISWRKRSSGNYLDQFLSYGEITISKVWTNTYCCSCSDIYVYLLWSDSFQWFHVACLTIFNKPSIINHNI